MLHGRETQYVRMDPVVASYFIDAVEIKIGHVLRGTRTPIGQGVRPLKHGLPVPVVLDREASVSVE